MLKEAVNMERILGVCEKVCYFFTVNLLFCISVFPVLLFFLFVGISRAGSCLPLFLACLASAPPALSAVFYAMNRMARGTSRGGLRDYLEGYRMDFLQKSVLGAGQMAVVFILWTNLEFFAGDFFFLPGILLSGGLLVLTALVTPNLYLLASRYRMKNLEIVKSALLMVFLHPVCTLGNVAALGAVLAAFELRPGTAALFMASVYGFLVAFMNKSVLDVLEQGR